MGGWGCICLPTHESPRGGKDFRAELQLVSIPTSAPQMSMLNASPDTGGNKGAEAGEQGGESSAEIMKARETKRILCSMLVSTCVYLP